MIGLRFGQDETEERDFWWLAVRNVVEVYWLPRWLVVDVLGEMDLGSIGERPSDAGSDDATAVEPGESGGVGGLFAKEIGAGSSSKWKGVSRSND